MKTVALLIATLLVNCTTIYAVSQQRSIPNGTAFISPDGRYSVKVEVIDRLPHYIIEDTKTRKVDRSIIMPSLLLYLHWAADSRSFVAVEHIPHGSCGRVIYQAADKWVDVEVRPPSVELKDAAVVGLEIAGDNVHYRFAARHIKPNGMPIRYGFYDLDVSLERGRISNVRWSSAKEREWATSLEQRTLYIPRMKPIKSGRNGARQKSEKVP